MGNIQYSQQPAQQKHVPIWVNAHESWSYATVCLPSTSSVYISIA